MASHTKEGNTRCWVAGLALHLHGYREFIVSRHHTLRRIGALFLLPRFSPFFCADRLDAYIFFSSLSLPHCVCLLSNLFLDSFQARAWTFQTRHISSASWHQRPSSHKYSHVRQSTYLQT